MSPRTSGSIGITPSSSGDSITELLEQGTFGRFAGFLIGLNARDLLGIRFGAEVAQLDEHTGSDSIRHLLRREELGQRRILLGASGHVEEVERNGTRLRESQLNHGDLIFEQPEVGNLALRIVVTRNVNDRHTALVPA